MGQRIVTVKESVARNIAAIAFFIESEGMVKTAEKFADSIYDYFLKLADTKRSFAGCRNPVNLIMKPQKPFLMRRNKEMLRRLFTQ